VIPTIKALLAKEMRMNKMLSRLNTFWYRYWIYV